MILHILNHSAFTRPFVDLLNSGDTEGQHEFLILSDGAQAPSWVGLSPHVSELCIKPGRIRGRHHAYAELRKRTQNAERVFLHSMFEPISEFMFMHPRIA